MTDTGELIPASKVETFRRAMAKKKKQAEESAGEQSRGKLISYRPSAAVEAALEQYRSILPFRPDKQAVIERALRDFLRAQPGVVLADEQR